MKKTGLFALSLSFCSFVAQVAGAADHVGGTEVGYEDTCIVGQTFSGTYEKSIYIVKGGRDVVFESCTFDGVSAEANGSCVYIDRDVEDRFGAVTFRNCRFINCGNTHYDGGAIYVQNNENTIQHTVFENCVAIGCKAENGGFIYINDNEAGVYGKGNTIITGCSADYGGGVYANRLDTFDGFIFVNNTATEDGGGLYDVNTYGEGDVRNCQFYCNSAGDEGGGLYVDDSDGAVKNCRFIDNTASEDADFYIDDSSTTRENNVSTSDLKERTFTGDGTETNPIQIMDVNDWDALCCAVKGGNTYENAFITLAANIVTYNSVGVFNSDSAKRRPFMGSFNGNGHTITMYFYKGSNRATFSCAVDATIRNLTVSGRIEGGDSLGAIFGNASGSTASNCVNYAAIIGSGSYIGGIASRAGAGSKFINCINGGDVAGTDYVGGIVGCEDGAVSVGNCHSFGSVKSIRGNAGGITGKADAGSTYELCLYCNEHCPNDDCGTGASHGALLGDGTETAIELPEAMEDINNYIRTNDKEKDGWLRVARNRDGWPILVPNGITDEIGFKIQDISDSEYLYLKFRRLYSVKNNAVSNLNCRVVTDGTGSIGGGEWYIVEGTVSRGKIDVNGTANIVLLANSSLTAQSDYFREQGISVTEGNTLNIFGAESGKLTAIGGSDAAGIGGGRMQSCGTVNIYGGTVTATGGNSGGAGIGGGLEGNGGTVTINGGSVAVQAGEHAAGIGQGWGGTDNGSLTLGIRVLEIDGNHWQEGVIVTFDIPANLQLGSAQVDGGKMKRTMNGGTCICTLGKGHSLTLKFVPVDVRWFVVGEAEVAFGPILADAVIDANELPEGGMYDLDATNYVLSDGTSGSSSACPLHSYDRSMNMPSGWYVVAGEVTTRDITVQGTVNLILADGAKLTVNGGIRVGTGNTLNIFSQRDGTGRLAANGPNYCAGIGGGDRGACGTVTVAGGIVAATGGDYAAGIGGGDRGAGGTVTVTGGIVSVIGGRQAAGIGGGAWGAGGTVTVSGGTVEAQGGWSPFGIGVCAGIGGGYNSVAGGSVTLGEGVEVVEGAVGHGSGYVKITEKTAVPVTPGEAAVYETPEAAAEAAAKAVLKPSAEVAAALGSDAARQQYCAMFEFAVTPTSDGKWAVEAFLKPPDWTNVVESAQTATRQIPLADIAALPLYTPTNVTAKGCGVPGFYYSFYSGSTMTNIRVIVSDQGRNVLCGTDRDVEFEGVVKPSDESGFFSIGVLETPTVYVGGDYHAPTGTGARLPRREHPR